MNYILKINRKQPYVYKNLQHWIDLLCDRKEDIILLCDDGELKEQVELQVDFHNCSHEYVESERNIDQLKEIAGCVSDDHWRNAALAHLTTFHFARERGWNSFWNIDADDTFFCLTRKKTRELLEKAQEYADENGINAFSLDMWASRNGGCQWSFGITYTDMKMDWISMMYNHRLDHKYYETQQLRNLDVFLSYLRNEGYAKLESFYADNLRFVHYSNDFLRRPIASGLYHWKSGKLNFPILMYIFNSIHGQVRVPDEIVCLELDITDEEGICSLVNDVYPWDAEAMK